jgi:hypothetical protein
MIYETITKYHALSKRDIHHRYKSWEHCFNFFSKNHSSMYDEKVFDESCLQLAFYLASWGMMRGGSFLLQKDYRVHEYFIKEVVLDSKFQKYFELEQQLVLDPKSILGINELISATENSYINNITEVNGQEKSVSVTDTLTSKILLGVFAIVPAYDRYLVEALKLHGIKSQLNEQSLLQIVEFYNQHCDEFARCQQVFNNEGVFYTPMKLIDMYFFQIGYIMDTNEEPNEELYRILDFAAQFKNSMDSKKGDILKRKVEKPIKNLGLKDMIQEYIIDQLKQAKAVGVTSVELKSGDIHRSLKLEHRMPSVCNAMVSLGVFRYEIIQDTPSGASSTRLVRYYLS